MSKNGFRVARIITFAGFLILLGLIIYGVVARDISAEGSILLSIFWGQFTFADIYIAFTVIYIWIVLRERSVLKSILWFVLIMAGGSMSICLYLFIALSTCDDNLEILLMGRRRKDDVG